MILASSEIAELANSAPPLIDPFDEGKLEPASYDLRVGRHAVTVTDRDDLPEVSSEHPLVIRPYAPAIIHTLEVVNMPLNVIGRLGVKSDLPRRGVHATLGLQVDPGFCGPLSVTLFNLSPTDVVLGYGESFVSIDFQRLEHETRGYEGPHKNMEVVTPQEMQSVLGFKGQLRLTEAVSHLNKLQHSITEVASLSSKFDKFLTSYEGFNKKILRDNQRLVREMKSLVQHVVEGPPIEVRDVPRSIAKQEILALFHKSKEPLFYSDIADQLRLDFSLVVDICREIEKSGEIEEATT